MNLYGARGTCISPSTLYVSSRENYTSCMPNPLIHLSKSCVGKEKAGIPMFAV